MKKCKKKVLNELLDLKYMGNFNTLVDVEYINTNFKNTYVIIKFTCARTFY